jgi:RNA polymerase sigma-54 factor
LQQFRAKNRLDAAALGKIVLARCLSQHLRAYQRTIEIIEDSPRFQSASWVTCGLLAGASVEQSPSASCLPASSLGRFVADNNRPTFIYRASALVREYRFDEASLDRLRALDTHADDDIALLHRLRLVNSRNRLTHALMTALLDMQRKFLVTGDPLALAPLTQAGLSSLLTASADLPMVADPGRISRLVRSLAFTLPNGRTLPLASLLPGERQVHCHRIDFLIKREKKMLLAGKIGRPWSDAQLAALLERQYGVTLSRRSIAAIRHQLAIPDSRRRAAGEDYQSATEGFSPLLPMSLPAVAMQIPPHPGVYEIRAPSWSPGGAEGRCNGEAPGGDRNPVVYIGSTRDLRKRLSDHLRGSSGNIQLSAYLAGGRAKVRFRTVQQQWRLLERHLYRMYCETFGVPPACNRMSP